MDSNTVRNISALPPETLANILRFLPARSLVNALLVCRLWKDLAQRELTQRKYFVSRVFECRKEIQFFKKINDIREQILEFLNDIDIVPSAVVMSCYHIGSPWCRKKFLLNIAANLPKHCVVIGTRGVKGIIGETNFGYPVVEGQICSGVFSVLFIPKVKGVNVNFFQTKIKEINGNKEEWRTKLDHLVDKDIKFLFLTREPTSGKHINDIWSNTIKVLGKQVVIGDSLAKPFAVVNNETISCSVMGLAIGGNIEASNVVQDGYRGEGSEIRKLLQRMPILNQSRGLHPTACFLTPCIWQTSNVEKETSQVRKAFPHMKIFGFLGLNGEIGTNSCQRYKDDKKLRHVMPYYRIALSILKLL